MASTLLLVPTQFEWNCLSRTFLDRIRHQDVLIELCGFGPIVSTIRATRLIAQHRPNRVMLAGIAGGLVSSCRVGSALEFDEVVCYGIGAGSGAGFLTTSEMGWSQWPSEPGISDSICLSADTKRKESTLLTCCAASANEQDVQLRLEKYSSALAEDMEGFSVAAACRFAGVPLQIVRGISNRAGDRDKSHWQVDQAMAAVEHIIGKAIAS